ncbi:MAG TPA: hemolysin family protein [Polyangiaceae bacterium]|nr:hemolysin family protein [Polyangiaceae bacterium]
MTGASQAALDRYLLDPATVESRWLVLRVLGLGACAIIVDRGFPPTLGTVKHGLALLAVLFVYGTPAYLGMVLARRAAEETLPYALRALRPFELLISPLALPLRYLGTVVSGNVRHSRLPSASLAESEVSILVTEGEQSGALGHEPAEMIRNVLDFGDLKAGDVMIPRTQVAAIDLAMGADELLKFVADGAHSRYPVYRERIDNIVGILHVKDLINHAARADLRTVRVSDVMRTPVVFVPETQTASSLLKDMRAGRRHHMAIIIDEFGGMSGVVTLEDVIEEIVGDIRDEHDTDEPPIVDLGNGRLMVDAGVPIGDLSRYLGVALPEDGDYNSLGGFLVERLGQVPSVGATVSDYGLDFVIRDADDRKVSKVEIIRTSQTPGPGPESLPPMSPRRSAA